MIQIEAKQVALVAKSRDDVCAYLEQMRPEDRAQVSPAWLALLDRSSEPDPWVHGFKIVSRASGSAIGHCGFKGPPNAAGVVEIAYGIDLEHRGKGYATEAAAALTHHAFCSAQVRQVIAHTLPEPNASTRVLTKCGFQKVGEVIDPEDGLVWRWQAAGP